LIVLLEPSTELMCNFGPSINFRADLVPQLPQLFNCNYQVPQSLSIFLKLLNSHNQFKIITN